MNVACSFRSAARLSGRLGAVACDQPGRQTQDAVTAWGSSAADRSIERLTTRYDARGLVAQADSFGSAAPAVNSVSFAHNGWRQLTTETQAAGSVSRNVQYGYDGTGAGLVTTIRRNYLLYPSAPSAAAGPAAVFYTYSGPHADQLSRPSHIQALEVT